MDSAGGSGPVGRIFSDQDMIEGLLTSFVGGQAAVYSARSPGKDGPNEDAAGLVPVDARQGVLAVADGVGGRPGGAEAAQTALHSIEKSLGRAAHDEGSLRAAILDGLEEANRALLELGSGAATTVAATEIAGNSLRPYHVGDSAVLVVGQRGRIKLETISHSPVGYAVESGLLDRDEAMHHEERHLISNAVGAPDMRIEVGSPVRLAPRDTLLLATDGLFDNLSRQEIVEIIRTRPLEQVCRSLAEACAERIRAPRDGEPSKPDDVTFILFRLDD